MLRLYCFVRTENGIAIMFNGRWRKNLFLSTFIYFLLLLTTIYLLLTTSYYFLLPFTTFYYFLLPFIYFLLPFIYFLLPFTTSYSFHLIILCYICSLKQQTE